MAWIIDYTHGTGAVDMSYILIQREKEKIWDWPELLKPQSQPQWYTYCSKATSPDPLILSTSSLPWLLGF